MDVSDEALRAAASAIRRALGSGGLLITAGAGMGVDSGLPDFRGTEGFWRAYPPFERLGLRFEQMANPGHFDDDPELAWGFYGHRHHLYRDTEPHDGFHILRRWADRAHGGDPDGGHGAFVFTSNVDGHFQRAGFDDDRVMECHGSLRHLQCSGPCGDTVLDAEGLEVAVDPETFRAAPPLPSCPICGAVARPNVLMFGDWRWVPRRTGEQEVRMREWLAGLEEEGAPLTVVEMGAGTGVPTVRRLSEHLLRRRGEDATLVRINPREPEGPPGTISLAAPALETLRAIDRRLGQMAGERTGETGERAEAADG